MVTELVWKPPVWVRTTIDEDEVERQRISAILAKLPPPDADDEEIDNVDDDDDQEND